jgi:hypothetical protein
MGLYYHHETKSEAGREHSIYPSVQFALTKATRASIMMTSGNLAVKAQIRGKSGAETQSRQRISRFKHDHRF